MIYVTHRRKRIRSLSLFSKVTLYVIRYNAKAKNKWPVKPSILREYICIKNYANLLLPVALLQHISITLKTSGFTNAAHCTSHSPNTANVLL